MKRIGLIPGNSVLVSFFKLLLFFTLLLERGSRLLQDLDTLGMLLKVVCFLLGGELCTVGRGFSVHSSLNRCIDILLGMSRFISSLGLLQGGVRRRKEGPEFFRDIAVGHGSGNLRIGAHAVWIGARDPEVPFPVRLLGWMVAAYAFSPIDLIPDFIPVLGLIDDLILVPLGIWLFVRLIPPELHVRHCAEAAAAAAKPVSTLSALVIIAIWIGSALWFGSLIWSARFW